MSKIATSFSTQTRHQQFHFLKKNSQKLFSKKSKFWGPPGLWLDSHTCLEWLSTMLDESSTAKQIWYSLLLGLVLLSQILSLRNWLAM